MSPGPAPTLLADWVTAPFVAAVFVIAGIWWAVFTIRAIRQDRLDAMPDPQPEPESHTCQIGNCHRPGTNTYDKHPSGVLLVCDMHSSRVQRWTGTPGRPASEQVYDVELDGGTDLGRWEQEMRS